MNRRSSVTMHVRSERVVPALPPSPGWISNPWRSAQASLASAMSIWSWSRTTVTYGVDSCAKLRNRRNPNIRPMQAVPA